jgi:hypothetical protein
MQQKDSASSLSKHAIFFLGKQDIKARRQCSSPRNYTLVGHLNNFDFPSVKYNFDSLLDIHLFVQSIGGN